MASRVIVKTATFTASTTSNILEIGDAVVVAIIPSTGWATNDLTLKGGVDGTVPFTMYDSTVTQLKVTAAAINNAYAFKPVDTAWPKFLQLVSGGSQTAASVLVILKDI